LENEIVEEISEMSNRKAEGVIGILAKFWKFMQNKVQKELGKFCQAMYE